MSKYEARITQTNGTIYALIVRIDRDGQSNVINGYNGRYFKTMKAAEKSTFNHIQRIMNN